MGGFRIEELPVPTFYGDEICHVNGIPYAAAILWTSLLSRIQRLGLLYDRRFDVACSALDNQHYRAKFDFPSSHSFALERVQRADSLLILGSGPAELVGPFAEKATATVALDVHLDPALGDVCDRAIEADLDSFDVGGIEHEPRLTRVLALDIVEHLRSPEDLLRRLREAVNLQEAQFVFTTANVGFLPIRVMLLLGQFNYGKSGILDQTHTRLFTFASFTRLFEETGFEVIERRGIPAPFPLALGRMSRLARLLLRIHGFLVRIWPGGFAYQIMVVARPLPTVRYLLGRAVTHSLRKAEQLVPPGASRARFATR
jgi:hypothetical protein